ncbi:hypothetical protein EV363DRAFT_1180317 [Boletus edulis]|nr:hypothetical protein EV363DRAFT_1180317 [Boletus edulis]
MGKSAEGARLAGWGVSCEGGWERLAGACARQSGSRAPDPCEAPEWEWRQGVVGGCAETGNDEQCGEDERRGGGAKTRRAAARLRRLSCPKTSHCGFTRASLRHSPSGLVFRELFIPHDIKDPPPMLAEPYAQLFYSGCN